MASSAETTVFKYTDMKKYNIVLLGSGATGKTCLVKQFVQVICRHFFVLITVQTTHMLSGAILTN